MLRFRLSMTGRRLIHGATGSPPAFRAEGILG
jgi:hypothetical protein